jgi:hypothetical protein
MNSDLFNMPNTANNKFEVCASVFGSPYICEQAFSIKGLKKINSVEPFYRGKSLVNH